MFEKNLGKMVKARQFLLSVGINFNPLLARWNHGEDIPLYRAGKMMYLIPDEFLEWMQDPTNHSHTRIVKNKSETEEE